MNDYKEKQRHGEKKIKDEYTGKDNLYVSQNNMPDNYNDETHRKQAQPDHIVPLKQLHEQYKHNYALDDSDLKRIANSESNLAITSAEINQVKRDMTNKQYIEWMDEHGKPLDENTKKIMLQKQKEATKSIESDVNKTVAKNLVGKGQVDEKAMKNAVNEFKENNGQAPTEEQRNQIEQNLIKKKTNEIRGTAVKNAAGQAKDYAVGNLILFIVKPIYYEISDIFKNGLKEGVGADSGSQALGIRFTRVKKYVMTPDIAITLPPINLIIASPFCAGDIAFAFLPNRICTEPTSIFTPSFRIFRTCFNIPTNKLIIPSINEDTKPLTKSNILSPKNAFA